MLGVLYSVGKAWVKGVERRSRSGRAVVENCISVGVGRNVGWPL